MDKRTGQNRKQRIDQNMLRKLPVLCVIVMALFLFLLFRLFMITNDNGDSYKKQILSQLRYDSTVIPYKRGSILDTNGNILATSEKVYNVILDSCVLKEGKEELIDSTLSSLSTVLGVDGTTIRNYYNANKDTSRYYVVAKKQSYDKIQILDQYKEEGKINTSAIWYESEYQRLYPDGSLASDIIGYTGNDNSAFYGLEEFYNSVLSGTPGREYGYMNESGALERTTIPAEDGNTIVTTIDANIQSMVEKYLYKFNEQYTNNARTGNGANNVGCIIMNVNTGEILAMASYPNFDPNNPTDPQRLIGMPMLDEDGKRVEDPETGTKLTITEENVDTLEGEALKKNLYSLWKNFCITDAYEPGSVSKPLTVAAGIECGAITGNETYNCNGYLEIGNHKIHCHNRYGDGLLTVSEGIERSCNVNMMYVAQAMGIKNFTRFQHAFNMGLKTNIDLAGEARTDTLIYYANNMNASELASCSFGQGYNCTMIQMIAAFSSLVNGGYYYEPHMVKKIINSSGATVENIEPRLLKQTVSQETSQKIIEMCNTVVTGENGTGKTARPAGYMIGGKTGTAETLPRGNKEYVVSFMGYAPADNPEIAIYVVVDRPNAWLQDDAKFATRIVRNILTEVLPYMGIFMTEELSDSEKKELEELQLEIITPTVNEDEAVSEETEAVEETAEEAVDNPEVWKSFKIDPITGYAIDPNTGEYVDPVTGATIGGTMGDELIDDDNEENEDGEIQTEKEIGVAGVTDNVAVDEDSPW